MAITVANQLIGDIDNHDETIKASNCWQVLCRLTSIAINEPSLNGRSVESENITMIVKAEVMNTFENFEIEMFFTASAFNNSPSQFSEALQTAQTHDALIVAYSHNYSILDGTVTFYNPLLTVYEDKFSSFQNS